MEPIWEILNILRREYTNMRTISIFLVSFLALVSATLAHGEGTGSNVIGDEIVLDGKTIRAGTTPDSFLYGLDVAIDQIRYLLTFDNKAKAMFGLEIARERLLEVREMILENKTDAAQRAQNEHGKSLERVKNSIAVLARSNSTQQIAEEIEIEKELEEHESEVKAVNEELKVKIKVKGEITPEQQSLIDSVLSLMENKTGEVKIKIENKKGETKIKIKIETGKSDEEIEDEIKELEEEIGLSDIKREKAEEQIEDALEELNETKARLLEVNATAANLTAVNELISLAEEKLAQSQSALNETKSGEAFGQSTAAEQLAKNANKILENIMEKVGEDDDEEEEPEETKTVNVSIVEGIGISEGTG